MNQCRSIMYRKKMIIWFHHQRFELIWECSQRSFIFISQWTETQKEKRIEIPIVSKILYLSIIFTYVDFDLKYSFALKYIFPMNCIVTHIKLYVIIQYTPICHWNCILFFYSTAVFSYLASIWRCNKLNWIFSLFIYLFHYWVIISLLHWFLWLKEKNCSNHFNSHFDMFLMHFVLT